MPECTEKFLKLVSEYKTKNIEFPNLKAITIAQWMLECGRGHSGLAREHNNFAGIKWRSEMKPYATRVLYDAPSEKAYFSSFHNINNFIEGYWKFLDRSPYKGWREYASNEIDFIEFIGKIWATDDIYADKVEDLLAEAEKLLEDAAPGAAAASDDDDALVSEGIHPCCDEMFDDAANEVAKPKKPDVDYIPSPYQYSRNGAKIEYIVMHYTTTRSLSSTVNHFKNNSDQVACHYVIARDGKIVQMVRDDRKCNHGNSKNSNSIGIEHSARQGDQMTPEQEAASLALIRWLKAEYSITSLNIIPHKCAPRATRCPGELFSAYGADGASSCKDHHSAVQKWLAAKL